MITMWNLLPWVDGEPTEPGLYLVLGCNAEGRMLASVTGTEPVRTVLGMCRVSLGPRGGRRRPRWMSPPARAFAWPSGWAHIALRVLAQAWCDGEYSRCLRCDAYLAGDDPGDMFCGRCADE